MARLCLLLVALLFAGVAAEEWEVASWAHEVAKTAGKLVSQSNTIEQARKPVAGKWEVASWADNVAKVQDMRMTQSNPIKQKGFLAKRDVVVVTADTPWDPRLGLSADMARKFEEALIADEKNAELKEKKEEADERHEEEHEVLVERLDAAVEKLEDRVEDASNEDLKAAIQAAEGLEQALKAGVEIRIGDSDQEDDEQDDDDDDDDDDEERRVERRRSKPRKLAKMKTNVAKSSVVTV